MSIPAHEAKSRLIEGNKRFINATSNRCFAGKARGYIKEWSASICDCSVLFGFQTGTGSNILSGNRGTFVIRVAGNVVDSHQLEVLNMQQTILTVSWWLYLDITIAVQLRRQ